MSRVEQDEGQCLCPQCGEAAEWRSLDANGVRVEMECPNCGRFTLSREEFESATLE